MAALQPLLDSECGTTNPLIKLTQFYTHDNTHVTQDGLIKPSSHHFLDTNLHNSNNNTIIDELVNEYHKPILAPNTFHLENLLTNLHLSDKIIDKHEYQWTKEFLNSTNNQVLSSIHSQQILCNEQNYIPSFILHSNSIFFDQQPSLIDAGFDNDTIKSTQNILSFLQESQFTVNNQVNKKPIDNLQTQEITQEMKDSNVETERQHDWINDATNSVNDKTWFRQLIDHVDNYSEYKFTKTNQFLDYINPFEEGLKHLEIHDIVNAILFFEAAIQKKSNHIDAWLFLGITQSKNEQDGSAICALKKCIELDSKNLQAYITLAACYTNEMLIKEAFNSLYKWLANNNKYSHLLSNCKLNSMINNEIRMINELTFEKLKDLFFQAISLSNTSNEIDVDLQVCLGILFYLHNDYNKASECFNTAFLAKPNDALLWNKLGAAIANSGHNEKAVNAYYHALTLSPGFIRARYNLGISCFNLNAYKQAIEHFLIALKQQNNSINPYIQMSENIWRTLACAIERLKRSDLEQFVVYRDLKKLFYEFQIE